MEEQRMDWRKKVNVVYMTGKEIDDIQDAEEEEEW